MELITTIQGLEKISDLVHDDGGLSTLSSGPKLVELNARSDWRDKVQKSLQKSFLFGQ